MFNQDFIEVWDRLLQNQLIFALQIPILLLTHYVDWKDREGICKSRVRTMVSEPSIGTNSVFSNQYRCSWLRHLWWKFIQLLLKICSINKYYRESINAFSLFSSHTPDGIRNNSRTTGTPCKIHFNSTFPLTKLTNNQSFDSFLTSFSHTWAEIFFQF